MATSHGRKVLASDVTRGVLVGLVIGKFAGITAFSWAAVRLGLARLPKGVSWAHLAGGAWLAGIGFTMSLFIAQLAFDEPRTVDEARIGILLASAVSAAVGLVWLFGVGSRTYGQRMAGSAVEPPPDDPHATH